MCTGMHYIPPEPPLMPGAIKPTPWQPPPPLAWYYRHPTIAAFLAAAVLFLTAYLTRFLP